MRRTELFDLDEYPKNVCNWHASISVGELMWGSMSKKQLGLWGLCQYMHFTHTYFNIHSIAKFFKMTIEKTIIQLMIAAYAHDESILPPLQVILNNDFDLLNNIKNEPWTQNNNFWWLITEENKKKLTVVSNVIAIDASKDCHKN